MKDLPVTDKILLVVESSNGAKSGETGTVVAMGTVVVHLRQICNAFVCQFHVIGNFVNLEYTNLKAADTFCDCAFCNFVNLAFSLWIGIESWTQVPAGE